MSVMAAARVNVVSRARSRSSIAGSGRERLDQLPDSVIELVADPAHDLERLARAIRHGPILVGLAGIDGARVSAAERHDDVCSANDVVGERFGELTSDVDSSSLIASTTTGLIRSSGREPAHRTAIQPFER